MSYIESPVVFACNEMHLLGITHHGDQAAQRGVVIVVGGPQYRVGSHRQFLLLARGLAEQGIPVFRFDCRGMGDGEGKFPGFEAIDDDISAAINAFCEEVPSLKEIVIWGLCDGASAASFYAHKDERVTGLILVNPWIRTEQGEAKAYLKHYYFRRLVDKAFWTKVFSGKFEFSSSVRSLLGMCKRIFLRVPEPISENDAEDAFTTEINIKSHQLSLPERFYQGLKAFSNPILLITSGNDLTAAEFLDVINRDKPWRKLSSVDSFHHETLPEADHTFSKRESMDEAIAITLTWLKAY